MATYNVNSNLPGAFKTTDVIPVVSVPASVFLPVIPVLMDPEYMQKDFDGYADGYLLTGNGSTATSIKFGSAVLIGVNELAGHYIAIRIGGVWESQLIASNNAVTGVGNLCTVITDRPFSTAPSAGLPAIVRLWQDWFYPTLISSSNEFASIYLDVDSSGNSIWTNIGHVFQTLQRTFVGGTPRCWVYPVPIDSASNDQTVANLAVTTNEVLKTNLLALAPQPDIFLFAKMPSILVAATALTSAQYATIDNDIISYCKSRATNSSEDELLREIIYITDTPTDSVSGAITYRTSTLNTVEERVALFHGEYLVTGLAAGTKDIVSPAAEVTGIVNFISSNSDISFGHAIQGERFAQLGSNFGLRNLSLSQANRLQLETNGINSFTGAKGRGTWIESQWTQKKSSATTGSLATEFLHVLLTRAKIWNAAQPVLFSLVGEPNSTSNRLIVDSRLRSMLDTMVANGQIANYIIKDKTTSADILAKTAKWELQFMSTVPALFVELKLVASFAS
jgi:hypothetical protein